MLLFPLVLAGRMLPVQRSVNHGIDKAAEDFALQRDGLWHLGAEATGLARAILAAAPQDALRAAARPVLERFADATGETAGPSIALPRAASCWVSCHPPGPNSSCAMRASWRQAQAA